MKKYLLPSCIGLLLFFSNCQDDPKPQFFIDQETKDFTVFNEGTYWVYENQFNESDSQFVRRSVRSTENIDLNYSPEVFQLNIKSSYFDDEIIYQSNINESNKSIFLVNQLWAKSFSSFFYTYISKDSLNKGKITIISLKDTLLNYNNGYYKFQNIKKFSSFSEIPNSYLEVYWAKHIGRIEYLDTEGKRWKLKRFKIFQ